jgi:hypothetical protein
VGFARSTDFVALAFVVGAFAAAGFGFADFFAAFSWIGLPRLPRRDGTL